MHRSIIIGQLSLIVCCIFYLIWWSLCYKPNVVVDRLDGIRGALLLITALCGLVGVCFSVHGMGMLSVQHPMFSGSKIIGVGILTYIVLLLITVFGFHRPVTTELLLITGWMMLETCLINDLYGAQIVSSSRYWGLMIVLVLAFFVSMVLYVLYYRMEPMKAYYAAMVPLITEAISMAIVLILSF